MYLEFSTAKLKKLKDGSCMRELVVSIWEKWKISKADIVYTQFRSFYCFLRKRSFKGAASRNVNKLLSKR